MGDDTPVEVCGKGIVSLEGGYFDNVLHVPSLSMKFISIYQITHSGSRKKGRILSGFSGDFRLKNRVPGSSRCCRSSLSVVFLLSFHSQICMYNIFDSY
jgi:hypothetical protein